MNAGEAGPPVKFPHEPGGLARSANPGFMLAQTATRAANAVSLTLAGVFDRFPALQIYWAETQVGWYPSAMEQIDDQYERVRHWGERFYGMAPLKRLPSEYIREHCYFGFTRDIFGVRNRHEIGVDRMMWASDFPHGAGDWPHSRDVIEEMFAGVPAGERYQIVAGNAIEFFHLDNEA
jgi:predicted TIM-barrel fold metal-dependent hydrolase